MGQVSADEHLRQRIPRAAVVVVAVPRPAVEVHALRPDARRAPVVADPVAQPLHPQTRRETRAVAVPVLLKVADRKVVHAGWRSADVVRARVVHRRARADRLRRVGSAASVITVGALVDVLAAGAVRAEGVVGGGAGAGARAAAHVHAGVGASAVADEAELQVALVRAREAGKVRDVVAGCAAGAAVVRLRAGHRRRIHDGLARLARVRGVVVERRVRLDEVEAGQADRPRVVGPGAGDGRRVLHDVAERGRGVLLLPLHPVARRGRGAGQQRRVAGREAAAGHGAVAAGLRRVAERADVGDTGRGVVRDEVGGGAAGAAVVGLGAEHRVGEGHRVALRHLRLGAGAGQVVARRGGCAGEQQQVPDGEADRRIDRAVGLAGAGVGRRLGAVADDVVAGLRRGAGHVGGVARRQARLVRVHGAADLAHALRARVAPLRQVPATRPILDPAGAVGAVLVPPHVARAAGVDVVPGHARRDEVARAAARAAVGGLVVRAPHRDRVGHGFALGRRGLRPLAHHAVARLRGRAGQPRDVPHGEAGAGGVDGAADLARADQAPVGVPKRALVEQVVPGAAAGAAVARLRAADRVRVGHRRAERAVLRLEVAVDAVRPVRAAAALHQALVDVQAVRRPA